MGFRTLVFGVLLTVIGSGQSALAQHRYKVRRYNHDGRPYFQGPLHITLAGGTALYNGDLGNKLGNNFLGLTASLGVLYRLTPHFHLGSEFSYAEISAQDFLKERGLAFTSTNGIGTVFFRYDLLPDESVFAATQAVAPVFQIYVQGGAGLLLYNPKSYPGTKRATENTSFLPPERNDYPAMAGVAPVGGGFTVRIADQLRLGLEGNYYFTTTDQLDDASVRLNGSSASKDGFGTVMLKLDFSIE